MLRRFHTNYTAKSVDQVKYQLETHLQVTTHFPHKMTVVSVDNHCCKLINNNYKGLDEGV